MPLPPFSIRHVRMVTDYLELSTHALPKQKLLSGMGLDEASSSSFH